MNDWKAMQDRSVWENSVKPLLGFAIGTKESIERLLSISVSEMRLNQVSSMLDTLMWLLVELGMELQKSDKANEVMELIREMKEERMNEDTI